jgi:hypothetical protein
MIIDELFEGPQLCPECGGISFSDLILAEKKDACYYKVKASAKVWPSAYASGRLVQCRKKGAANYGNKNESVAEGSLDEVSQDTARSYAQKAQASQKDLINQTHRKGADIDKLNKKIQNRQQGLNRAHTDKRYYKDEQGVAEGSDSEELANEVYAEFERIYPNLARKANERTVHAAVMDVLNYGGDSNPSALAQDVARAVKRDIQQGVAEGSYDNDPGIKHTRGSLLAKLEALPRGSDDFEWNRQRAIQHLKQGDTLRAKYYMMLMKRGEPGVAEGKEDKIAQLKKDYDTAVHWSKNDTNPHKREAARQKAEKIKRHLETQYKQGVAEGTSNIGSAIKSLYQKIYNAGDDEIEYFYHNSPIFAQYWDEYEGDINSIIAEVDPGELQVMLDELESYAQQAGLAEDQLDEKWSQKYKSSINCANPKGFSQRAHCAGRKKNEDVEESLGKQIHSTFQSMGDSFSDAHLAKGISYFLQGRYQEGENWLRGKIPQAAQDTVFGKLRTLQAQGGVDVNKNANVQQYIDDKLVPWVKNQIQQNVKEGEQQKGADYRDPKEVDYDDEYDAMVARVKKLAGLGPMRTVYDPNKRVYRNMPTAQQPKK